MRSAIWWGILVTLFLFGCRQQAAQSTAKDQSGSSDVAKPDADRPAPSKETNTSASAEIPSAVARQVVELDAITLTAPAGWERKPASSSFVAAEFSLPRIEGDDGDGRLTVSTAGGSVQANIDRWKGQFAPQPTAASQEEIEVAGLKITIVKLSGEFNDQRGPLAPAEKRANYSMIAVVIPIGDQLHFIKATGPEKTIAAHAEAIGQFIRSIHLNK